MNRLGRRTVAALICCVILVSIILPAYAQTEDIALTVDRYSEEEGSFALCPEARFFVITTQKPDDALTETLQLISSEFAAAGKPGKEPLPLCWGEAERVDAGDLIFGFSDKLAPQAYEIRVTEENAFVTAADTDGLLYGARTLLRLLLTDSSNSIACCVIADTPDTEQRAVMIDCARKYWTVPWLKNLISQMSWLGYNQLELHMGEDQGLRTDIWSGEPDRNGNDFSWLIGYDSGWNEDYPDPKADQFSTAADLRAAV